MLIVEVLSDSIRKYDSIDKFIQYQKITTLEYYLSVEPEFMYVNCCSKNNVGKYQQAIYNKPVDFVSLKNLLINLPIDSIYNL